MMAPAAGMPLVQFARLADQKLIPQLGSHLNAAVIEKASVFLRIKL